MVSQLTEHIINVTLRFQLWLSTKEERNEKEDDVTTDVKQHVGLIQQFAIYEIRQSNVRF